MSVAIVVSSATCDYDVILDVTLILAMVRVVGSSMLN